MIGVIVTGHGRFASGMQANTKMLAGESAVLEAVDFCEGKTVEQLDAELNAALARHSDDPFTLVFCDLAGGTPYNRAVTLCVGRPNVRVLSGTNASMLMDMVMRNITEDVIDDVDALAEELMDTGRQNISKFVMDVSPAEDETDGEGI